MNQDPYGQMMQRLLEGATRAECEALEDIYDLLLWNEEDTRDELLAWIQDAQDYIERRLKILRA